MPLIYKLRVSHFFVNGCNIFEIYNNIIKFFNIINNYYNNSYFFILSILKSPKMYVLNKIKKIDYLNNIIKKYCKNNNKFIYIDLNYFFNDNEYFNIDGIHLSIRGYNLLNFTINYIIKKCVKL